VTSRIGAHRQSVNRWARQQSEAEWAGLQQAWRAGRKPRLSPAGLPRLERGLKQGPQALGHATQLWTARLVVAKVESHFGELFPRVGFIVTNLETDSRAVVRFCKRGTAG
jgi:transposase